MKNIIIILCDTLGAKHMIVTSDHGEHFGEYGYINHFFSLHDELIHVPLLVKYPAGAAGEKRETRLCQLNDIFATIIDLLNLPYPTPVSSMSLLSERKRRFALAQVVQFDFWHNMILRVNPGYDLEKCDFLKHKLALVIDDPAGLYKLIINKDRTVDVYLTGKAGGCKPAGHEIIEKYRDNIQNLEKSYFI
ncbi:MAG: sulfatase-like hydrolase/transferase [Bacillota bacterium]